MSIMSIIEVIMLAVLTILSAVMTIGSIIQCGEFQSWQLVMSILPIILGLTTYSVYKSNK